MMNDFNLSDGIARKKEKELFSVIYSLQPIAYSLSL